MRLFFFHSVLAISIAVIALGCGESHSTDDGGITFDATRTDGGMMAMDGIVPGRDGGPPPVCGNGRLDRGESCDDGNTMAGDGCNATCRREAFCGDGNMDAGEVCDDGNNRSGDGCRSDCGSDESCGNDIRDVAAGEQCDDGNTMNGDGCSSDCTLIETCGDGTVDAPLEQCDDSNTDAWDGCGVDCQIEITQVMDTLTIGGDGVGCDFSGDGMPDNAFGAGVGGVISGFLGGGDLTDFATILLNYRGLDDLTGSTDDAVTIGWMLGEESMTTPGEFLVDPASLDLDMVTPLVTFEGSILAHVLEAGPEDVEIFIMFIPLEIRQAELHGTTRATSGRLSHVDDGLLCGAIPLDLFAAIPIPPDIPIIGGMPPCAGTEAPTFGDLIIAGAAILPGTPPDVDLDGDGLESFEVDEGSGSGCQAVVTACIDGDGTRVEGRSCLLDPRFQDGLSVGLPFTAVPATITGVM